MGKGKDTSRHEEALEHVSRPLSTLKDPASFAPPPKNVNYHGAAALPNQITPDKSGLGAPLTPAEIQAKQEREEEEERAREAEERQKKAPPLPFRVDTTGLSTTNLPPPPGRKDGADGRNPPVAAKPKPGLPPRLPPRQNSTPSQNPASPPPKYSATVAEPPAHKGILNQGSLSRLGAAGVSVPGFGIGGKQSLSPPPRTTPSMQNDLESTAASAAAGGSQLNELQSRFSRMSTSSSSSEAPAQGTSFAQKQAALRTASAFRNDPSSVSLNDARNAASVANNFRERHGDQVASGWKSANSLNQKYGLADKVGKYTSPTNNGPIATLETVGIPANNGPIATLEPSASPTIEMRDNTIAAKKAPPPPPKKKPGLAGAPTTGALPPLPLASKPKPNVSDF
jgi:hypothetical protein